MIFEQLFDEKSSTYTYIIASGKGREGLIIDPVIEKTEIYLNFLESMELKLVNVIDTHIHADHITGLNELHKRTNCLKIMGENSKSEVIDLRVKENDKIKIEKLELKTIYTPGHTDCSYSFLLDDKIFTGDTLLINGTGRTDFQNGDPKAQYDRSGAVAQGLYAINCYMGYKPFLVGFIAMLTVGIICILTIEIYLKLFI